MEAHLLAWISLLLRWLHFIAGVAWIGASFYFNWLENHLERTGKPDDVAGDLWAVHGGGFYYLKKLKLAPGKLPEPLHWFKWEAYVTWISGFALLCVVFYWNAQLYMTDPSGDGLSETAAIGAGLVALLSSWLFYDLVCRSSLADRNGVLGAVILAWFIILAFILSQLLPGRAAFIHVGAAIGTIMVANVFRVIIPSQKELVDAVTLDRAPGADRAAAALQRSRHNNYFTLPVLFIMISSHYPASYGHEYNWAILLVISLAGVLIRHYFNVRHLPVAKAWPLITAALLIVGLAWVTVPGPEEAPHVGGPEVSTTAAWIIVQRRCTGCHANEPANAAFSSAPLGVELDTIDKLRREAERVYRSTVINRNMPLGNFTQMTESERADIANWFENSSYNEAQ